MPKDTKKDIQSVEDLNVAIKSFIRKYEEETKRVLEIPKEKLKELSAKELRRVTESILERAKKAPERAKKALERARKAPKRGKKGPNVQNRRK